MLRKLLLGSTFALLLLPPGRPAAAQSPFGSPPPAPKQATEQEYTAYGRTRTLRLKVYREADLEARLEVQKPGPDGRLQWTAVPAFGAADGWASFYLPKFREPLQQYLCDLDLRTARESRPPSNPMVRLRVRRKGANSWLGGSWRGEFIPPAQGPVLAWTYWLPAEPPPWQSNTGILALLFGLTWAGSGLAVRAELLQLGLLRKEAAWAWIGWIPILGAVLFFLTHQAPPGGGLGRLLRGAPPPSRREEAPIAAEAPSR